MLLPLFSDLLCSSIVFIIRLPNAIFNKNIMTNTYIILAFRRFHKHNLTSLLFNRTSPSRTVPYRAFQQPIRFGSYIFEPYIVEREHWDPRFGSARARKFRAGRRFGSKMHGTVRLGSGMYGTVSPLWTTQSCRWGLSCFPGAAPILW